MMRMKSTKKIAVGGVREKGVKSHWVVKEDLVRHFLKESRTNILETQNIPDNHLFLQSD